MSMYEWAEQECRIACKRENPDFNFDSEDFDYGCSCYKSALKAYKSLCEDGHSGSSFGFTKRILEKLMDGQPLTPITDDDFFRNGREEYEKNKLEAQTEWDKERGCVSDLQCPRMFGLFREEYEDGRVVYHDNDRQYFINIENPSDTYSTNSRFLDEMFPITMPYTPKRGKYKIYAQTFLCDKNNGDFDTKGILYVITPEGEKVDVGIYMTEKNGKMERISKEEYEELLSRRLDKVSTKTAQHLLWTLIDNSASEKEIERRGKVWKNFLDSTKESIRRTLEQKCLPFDKSENWEFNTFNIHQSLCNPDSDAFEEDWLNEIHEYLMGILKMLN